MKSRERRLAFVEAIRVHYCGMAHNAGGTLFNVLAAGPKFHGGLDP